MHIWTSSGESPNSGRVSKCSSKMGLVTVDAMHIVLEGNGNLPMDGKVPETQKSPLVVFLIFSM